MIEGFGTVRGSMMEREGNARIQKLSMRHVDIANWILMNPGKSQADCAEHFGVTQAWMCTVQNSDLFKRYFAERAKQHQELVSTSVVLKAGEVAEKSFDVMRRKLDLQGVMLEMKDATMAGELALKALGVGAQSANGPQVQVNVGAVPEELLKKARDDMRVINAKNTEEYEYEELLGSEPLAEPEGGEVSAADFADPEAGPPLRAVQYIEQMELLHEISKELEETS